MRRRVLAALAVSAILSGCGGGSGGSSTQTTFPAFPAAGTGPFTLSELQSYANINSIDFNNLTPQLPGTANATYNGMIVLTERGTPSGDVDYLGRATLDANFSAGTLSGSASDFAVADTASAVPNVLQQVSGTLPVTNGNIFGPAFTANLDGQLNNNGTILNVDTDVTGVFAMNNGQNIAAATVDGTMNSNSVDGSLVVIQP